MNNITDAIMEYLDGGGSFKDRAGAKIQTYSNRVEIRLDGSKTKHRINYICICLENDGYYSISFRRLAGFRTEWQNTVKGLAVYQLLPFIINQTGIGGI